MMCSSLVILLHGQLITMRARITRYTYVQYVCTAMTAVLFASTQLSKSFPGGVNEAAASEGCCAEGESDA
jgi:hypothetical protein